MPTCSGLAGRVGGCARAGADAHAATVTRNFLRFIDHVRAIADHEMSARCALHVMSGDYRTPFDARFNSFHFDYLPRARELRVAGRFFVARPLPAPAAPLP